MFVLFLFKIIVGFVYYENGNGVNDVMYSIVGTRGMRKYKNENNL